MLAAFTVLTLAALLLLTRFGTVPDPWQRPLGTDFASFWSAGRLALDGHAALAWDPAAHGGLQARTFPAALGYRDVY